MLIVILILGRSWTQRKEPWDGHAVRPRDLSVSEMAASLRMEPRTHSALRVLPLSSPALAGHRTPHVTIHNMQQTDRVK